MKAVIIGCGKAKLDHAARADELYTGALFKKHLAYAKKFHPDLPIYILSAKYGFIAAGSIIEPYNTKMGTQGCISSYGLLTSATVKGIKGADVILLAGAVYQKATEPCFGTIINPFEGMKLGFRLQALNKALAD